MHKWGKHKIILFVILAAIGILIIGPLFGIGIFQFKPFKPYTGEFIPHRNVQPVLLGLDFGINPYTADITEFWKKHIVREVDIYIEKKLVTGVDIRNTDCHKEFDMRSYPVEHGYGYDGELGPRRICWINAFAVQGPDLLFRCVCFYVPYA